MRLVIVGEIVVDFVGSEDPWEVRTEIFPDLPTQVAFLWISILGIISQLDGKLQ